MDETKQVITKMLKENTGAHLLDSGGAYGRHYERNQERDFENEPAIFLEFDIFQDELEIDATLNLYHFLVERLEYDPEMDDRFHIFANQPENEDEHWLKNMEDFVEKELQTEDVDVINSYNGDDMLSQTIQYLRFTKNHDEYVILQIHGGCDVRGGYSTPRVFQEIEPMSLFDNSRCVIQCERSDVDPNQLELPGFERDNFPHHWMTDNAGYNWEWEESAGFHNLEDYSPTENEDEKGKGKIYIDEDGNGYCPLCGSELNAYDY